MVQMASVLTQAVTVEDVCRAVSEQLLPAFGVRELALYTVREGRMYLLWESGYPEGFLAPFEGVTLDTQLPGVHALTTRLPLFFESPEDLSGAYPGITLDRMSAWSFLPLIASGHPVGSCILGWDTPRRFTPDERSALTALSGLAAQALERARLYDAESAVARGLQEGLLPHRLPAVEGLRTTGRYLPGTQGMAIGGDWYDVITTGRGVALVIGDVEGHSVGAAAVMGQLRSAVHAFAASERPPQEVITHTNRHLAELDADVCATCCYIELDPRTGRAFAVRAGILRRCCAIPTGTRRCWISWAASCWACSSTRSIPSRSSRWLPAVSSPCTPTGSWSSPAATSRRASRRSAAASPTPRRTRWSSSPTGWCARPAAPGSGATTWPCC
ncbi:hypothetical protein STAFG_0280 [Streptomyces afghaniensis 772]|uniref:PPM-type phosphatase domain-containing protein n=1 Tax=Streptomyces afghaniensis 772 TaxID=1283301 RepID=S4MZF8_9ACTN|nr:hypothetical protein STAFG_0280 [Streptomyces afghaniensis 772]